MMVTLLVEILKCPKCQSERVYQRKNKWLICKDCNKEYSRKSLTALKSIKTADRQIDSVIALMCKRGHIATTQELMKAGEIKSNNTAIKFASIIRGAMYRCSFGKAEINYLNNGLIIYNFKRSNNKMLVITFKEKPIGRKSTSREYLFFIQENQKLLDEKINVPLKIANLKLTMKGPEFGKEVHLLKEFIRNHQMQLLISKEPELVLVQYFFGLSDVLTREKTKVKKVKEELFKVNIN